MSKHTPAPWTFVEREVMEDGSVYPAHILGGPDALQVCLMESISTASFSEANNIGTHQFTRDNAALIASAPAMLEALYEQYAFLADITHNWEGRHTTAGQARLIALRDLIVQATGRDEMEVQDEASVPRAAKGAS